MSEIKRSDSTSEMVGMAGAKIPSPPEWIHLTQSAEKVWKSIVRARDYRAWTNIDLEHAANLACCLSDLERLRRETREEGDIIKNLKGTPIVNPKHSLMETLSRRSVALSRMLHIHAEATEGESRHQKTKNKTSRDIRDELNDGDDLIPWPAH